MSGVTIDFQSLEDSAATKREGDSIAQIRVPIAALAPTLAARLEGEAFEVVPEGGARWKAVAEE